jgi:hypothetical protein
MLSRAQKKPILHDFLPETKTKTGLVPNSNYETRHTRTRHMQNKNQTTFYYKEEIKIKQSCDKKTYTKLLLKRPKVMGNFISIYTTWAPNSRKFLKNLPIYMWPMFTHVHPCVNYV